VRSNQCNQRIKIKKMDTTNDPPISTTLLQVELAKRNKLQDKLRADIRILLKLAHISKLRREDAFKEAQSSRSSSPENKMKDDPSKIETNKIKEELALVLGRIAAMSKVVVEKTKQKQQHVKTMAEEMERAGSPIVVDSRSESANSNTSYRREVWNPYRITCMSKILQRAQCSQHTQQQRQQQLIQDEQKKSHLWSNMNHHKISTVDESKILYGPKYRSRRKSAILSSVHRLALGLEEDASSTTANMLNLSNKSNKSNKSNANTSSAAANPAVVFDTALQSSNSNRYRTDRTYTKAVVIASAGALRCMECKRGDKALQSDADEDGQQFLYCEPCWADFYKERFDGSRLSSIGMRPSEL
jgi:hypothetical protein